MLDEDFSAWHLDQYTKSFLKQLPTPPVEPPAAKRQYQPMPNTDTDGLVRSSEAFRSPCSLLTCLCQKWSVFAASMGSPPVRGPGEPALGAEPSLAEHEQRLTQRLEFYRLALRRGVPTDCNCQYAAASDQLFGKTEKAFEIRSFVAKWLRQSQRMTTGDGRTLESYVRTPWDQYCAWVAAPNSWGDHITLFAIAQVYQVRITMVSSIPGSHFVISINPVGPAPQERVILLAHWGEHRYGSLTALPDDPNQSPAVKRSRSSSIGSPSPLGSSGGGVQGMQGVQQYQARQAAPQQVMMSPMPAAPPPSPFPAYGPNGSPRFNPYFGGPQSPPGLPQLSPLQHALLSTLANSPPARAIIAANSPPHSPTPPPEMLRLSHQLHVFPSPHMARPETQPPPF